MRSELHFDAVVIGAGVAGLVAGARLAEGGARVCVLAKGVGSTHLAPGTVDVLGYAPERVDEPGRAVGELIASRPDHPYALMGVEAIGEALSWLAERVVQGPLPGYRYVGGLERNHLLPTAVGVVRPSTLVPETMAGGDLRSGGPVCIVGSPVLRDFHASLCAANLARAGIEARSVEVALEVDRADQSWPGGSTTTIGARTSRRS
jgi:glycerol-3-phosphate dehydrogenase subunit B